MNIQDKKLYYIGGVVRDEILGLNSFDIDLTYDGDAIEFVKTIPNADIVQINEPFGTVRIKLDNQEIDIASTRSETYPNKGHLPVVDNRLFTKRRCLPQRFYDKCDGKININR